MKTALKIGIPLLLVLAAVFWLNRLYTKTVLVEPAAPGTAVNAVTGTVEIWANADLHIKAEHRGIIKDVPARVGEVVEAGAPLVVQSSEDLDLRIQQAEIRLESATARSNLESTHRIDLESLDEELEGVRLAVDLKQSPASRLSDLLRQRRKKAVQMELEEINLRESIRLFRNQLELLTLQKEQMTARAPFGGIVTEVFAIKGDLVNTGHNLIRFVSHGRFAMMELTEEDTFAVRKGQPVTLRLAGYPGRSFHGTVDALQQVADPDSKTRNVIVKVDEPDSVLTPGLTGEGYLVKDEREGSIIIPRRALIGNQVYCVVDGNVEVRTVTPGYLGLNKAEITSGLAEGDLVILEDQDLLEPGDRVRVVRSDER